MSYQDDNPDVLPPLPSERREWDDKPRLASPVAQKSGCSKGCIYGAVGCGCLSVLMLIGAVALLARVGFWVQSAQSADPNEVQTTAREIADFEPPLDLKPRHRWSLLTFKSVKYTSDDGEIQLQLEQVDQKFVGKPEGWQTGFDRGVREEVERSEPHIRLRRLEPVSSNVRQLKIRGQESKVTFAEAKDSSSGSEYQLIQGSFQGKSGQVQFELQIPKEKYKEEDVLKFLEGIK